MNPVAGQFGYFDHGFTLFAAWPLFEYPPFPTISSLTEANLLCYFLTKNLSRSEATHRPQDYAVFVPTMPGEDSARCINVVNRLFVETNTCQLMYVSSDRTSIVVENKVSGTVKIFTRDEYHLALTEFETERIHRSMCEGNHFDQEDKPELPLYDILDLPLCTANRSGTTLPVMLRVVEMVRAEPGILNIELGKRLQNKESASAASYYLRKAGVLVADKAGPTFRLSLLDVGVSAVAVREQLCRAAWDDFCERQARNRASLAASASMQVASDEEVVAKFKAWCGPDSFESIRQGYLKALSRSHSNPDLPKCSDLIGAWCGSSWTDFLREKLANGLVFEPDVATASLLQTYLGEYIPSAVYTHYIRNGYFAHDDIFQFEGIPAELIRDLADKLRGRFCVLRAEKLVYDEYHVIRHFLSHARFALGIPFEITIRECQLCGADFIGDYSGILDRLPSWSTPNSCPICPDCLSLRGYMAVRRSREELIADIKLFVEIVGYLPAAQFKDARVIRTVPASDYLRALKHLQKMACFEVNDDRFPRLFDGHGTYREVFDTWINACVEAELLDRVASRSSRGIRCIARDGHVCNSLGEKAIDDWLYSRAIEHSKEPPYPYHSTLNPFQMRADWKVGNTLIELWGMIGDPDYDATIQRKKAVAEHFGLSLIEVTPIDIADGLAKLDAALAIQPHKP